MDLKSTRLHQILKTILTSFVKFQKEDHKNPITLTLGKYTKKVELKTPCFFIISDKQGGDKMACSAACYSDKINRLCRKCDVKGEDSGNPYIMCNKIKMEPIQKLVEENKSEELKEMNQYNVQNAWFDVDFGGCPYGIFSAACPVEPLHSIENGIILNCLEILFNKIKTPTNWVNQMTLPRN